MHTNRSRSMHLTAALLACAAGLALSAAATAQDAEPMKADEVMPVKSISLYRSGVGYFERRGAIQGNQDIALTFSTDQVNDILKSMVVLDLGGGTLGAVTYGSNLPLERRLASFGVNVAGEPSIENLLRQLAGETVEIDTVSGKVSGVVLSVEHRATPVTNEKGESVSVANQPYVNLVTESGIRAVNIYDIRSFEIANEALADELNRALTIIAQYRAERTTGVHVELLGPDGKARPVLVGYMHEMPVWKTSYRLVLPEDTGSETEGTLQGWAIVENTTDSDWENVKLSLASGRPVSFTMNLHESIFAPRAELPVPIGGGLLPKLYDAGRELMRRGAGGPPPPAATAAPGRPGAKMEDPRMQFGADADVAGEMESLAFDQSIVDMSGYMGEGQAAGEQSGGQFMYTVEAPVTLERQQSAMLPIIVTGIPCERVSIYNPNDQQGNPMRGARLTNETGLHLMPGPIAVYDASSYAGDSQVPHMARNGKQLLTYAVDLDVNVTTKRSHDSNIMRLKIVDGMIEQSYKQRQTAEYTFDNLDAEAARTIVLEHPRSHGWDLVSQDKPAEETQNAYRFDVEVDPAADRTFTVAEETVSWQRIAITSIPFDQLLAFQRDGKISAAAIDAIKKAAGMQSAINTLDEQRMRLEQERSLINQDQQRLRENMQSISRDGDLYQRYLEKLDAQETRLESIITELDTLQQQRDAKERELHDYLRDLDVE